MSSYTQGYMSKEASKIPTVPGAGEKPGYLHPRTLKELFRGIFGTSTVTGATGAVKKRNEVVDGLAR